MRVQKRQMAAMALVLGIALSSMYIVLSVDKDAPGNGELSSKDETVVFFEGVFVCDARIADTPEKRAQGLIGTSRNETMGMLFIFEHASTPVFHMDGMAYSLDILFMNETGHVVEMIFNMTPNSGYYPSTQPSIYALELVDGRAAALGIGVGSKLEWER